MIKKMGGNQRASRRAKLEKLAREGTDATVTFVSGKKEIATVKGKVENRGGYWLVGYNIQLPLKDVRFNGHYSSLIVNVPEGGRVGDQLNREGYMGERK